MNKSLLKLCAIFAIVGMAFIGWQKEDKIVPEKNSLVQNDKLSTEGMVEYTDLFDAPSGHNLKTSMPRLTIYYKNFVTGHVRAYKAAYDYTHNQIWLAENFKEEQFFATKSLKNPNDPDGSKYGYFYFYNDIEIEPKNIDLPGPLPPYKQWDFFWDAATKDQINAEWRIPTHSDINKLVEHLGDIERAYSPTYGIDMRYTGWFYLPNSWQTTIADCVFWLQDNGNNTGYFTHWLFQSCGYIEGYTPNPHVFFSQTTDQEAASIRLVADL